MAIQILANNLRDLMDKDGLSEGELSKKSRVAQKTINNILNLGSSPTLGVIEKLARAFRMRPGKLISPNITGESSAMNDELLIPIIDLSAITTANWESVTSTPTDDGLKPIEGIGPNAFAVKIDHAIMGERFENQIVIFDPDLEVLPNDYVLVFVPGRDHPIFRKYLNESGHAYFPNAAGVLDYTPQENQEAQIVARGVFVYPQDLRDFL